MTKNKAIQKKDEREFIRKDILDAFQIYLKVPHFGSQKIAIIDMSMNGLSFRAEPGMQFNEGSLLDCHLYLNSSIRIPLQVTVVHRIDDCGICRAGCEISGSNKSANNAYTRFIELMLALAHIKDA